MTRAFDPDETVTIGRLIEVAGMLNEEMHVGAFPEYTRGQVELIGEVARVESGDLPLVEEAVQRASDVFFKRVRGPIHFSAAEKQALTHLLDGLRRPGDVDPDVIDRIKKKLNLT